MSRKNWICEWQGWGQARGPREDHRVDMVAHEGDSKMFKELNPTTDKTVKGGSEQGLLI